MTVADIAYVFDKAAFHLPTVERLGLDRHQAYVHGGLFFGWVVSRGLHASWLEASTPEPFGRFRRGEITGPELLKVWDGALLDDMFSDEGLAFAADYLHVQRGAYLRDYVRLLAADLPSELHVADSPENQARVSALLDERHRAWRSTWDPATGRPDLRSREEPPDEVLPDVVVGPSIPVGQGVPLPGGPLGIRAARPATVQAVRAAQAGDGWLLLVPDGCDLAVVARVERVVPVAGGPDALDVVLRCIARAEPGGDGAEVLSEPDPEDDDDLGLLDEIRLLSADLLKGRVARGRPPGLLALAPGLAGAALVDVVGRELALTREEGLLVLEAPDLRTRAETVRDALLREL